MTAPLLSNTRQGLVAASDARHARAAGQVHRYTTPVVREMTPAETDAQRRLVRASVLAKPI